MKLKAKSVITGEREQTVLGCCTLDGMSVTAISRHMGLTRKHIQRIKDGIVARMAEKLPVAQ